MIDESKIDWLLNGEEVEADILNRPLRQLVSATNAELTTELGSKVDKVTGKGLSDTNFTQAEKTKLSSLESSKFVGLFISDSTLPTTGSVGDYANVDGGVGSDVYRVIWDSSDSKWVRVQGVSTELTPAQIKQQYESNPNTNAFTDSEKSKLSGVATGATKNRADTLNADKTHTHPWAEITGQPETATRWPTYGEVSGKPATFPPSTHSHDWDQVTGKPTTFTPTAHSHDWDQVTGKPATYAPSRSTNTTEGGLKTRIESNTLWMTNNGTDA